MSKLSTDNGADVSTSSIVSSIVVGVIDRSNSSILDDIIDILVVSSIVIVFIVVLVVLVVIVVLIVVLVVIVCVVSISSLIHVVFAPSLGSWVGNNDWN